MGNKISNKNLLKKSTILCVTGLLTFELFSTVVVNAENKTAEVDNQKTSVSVQANENLTYSNDGGILLSSEELSSESLVNPYRDYKYRYHGYPHGNKSVKHVENVENKFDYVEMEPLVNGETMPDLSHLKYLVIHETGTFAAGAWATNVFSAFTKNPYANTTFIVDDNTVLKAMDLNEVGYALGNTDPAKSDVFNTNSISIEMCVNADGDYLKTVGNTVYLVRGILEKLPNLELKQHADAWSEGRNEYTSESFQKNCPEILRGNGTWWTWDRFLYFAKNKNLPIPFVDFNPTIESEVPNELREYLGFTYKAEEKAEEESNKSNDAIAGASKYITENSIFLTNNLSEEDVLEFDRYIEIDTESVFKNIKKSSQSLKLSDAELKSLIANVNLACKMEKMNPLIIIELMNSYTGYFSYGGSVSKEDNNFGGLKDKKGEYIKYSSINEGAIAFTQFIKTLTSKSKLKLKSENKDALKSIKKGSVKEFNDLVDALNVPEKFIDSVANRVLNY